ncbi:4'-phosphopantetheinyl transferase family protein [Pedobacter nyackensis]|uniref:4'-phosphopantetheinyl transferase n=1 Tax=Pedobacter nyackensis TaxID=475255 RepID=A0A1W2DDY9_9SPHI|nr:4'-phosphopantetheinyl transferase superfamily protein [Pedobacter nyackensis]SMC95725.1 4'-phosphopantetheinyl transferase [Pedobacter nyackensis]
MIDLPAGDINWLTFKKEACLIKDRETHLFKIEVDTYFDLIQDTYIDILNDQEITKASRFLKTKDAESYIVTRYVLRNLLAHFVLIPPADIHFHFSSDKKPKVDGIEFNISHSGNFIIIAISLAPIGIDIEFINQNFDFDPLMNAIFNEEESSLINKNADRLLWFYVLWTRKEAILKASGEGLTEDLTKLNVVAPIVGRFDTYFEVKSLLLDQNYVIGLATEVPDSTIHYWNFQPPSLILS